MKGETRALTDRNMEAFQKLFPGCVSEAMGKDGKIHKSVDYEKLRQMLGDGCEEGAEAYEFTWVGKKAAIAEAGRSTDKTLRPCPEESRKWDTTENLYIEGDNLEVLKLLQESYLEKIKMIYIDPPYNTGSDSFVYQDDYSMDRADYEVRAGLFDETGKRLLRENNETNPRFHSDWCSMMYARLLLARNLLSPEGVLAMSISDAEVHNLRKMADEIFGADNYCGDILWHSTRSVTNTALLSVSHTYTLIYFRDMSYFVTHRKEFRLADDGEGFANPDQDPRGPWKADPFQAGGWRPNQQYEIVNPVTGAIYRPNPGCSWKNDYGKFQELLADDRIVFGKTGEGGPQRKRFLWEAKERGKVARTWWDDVETTANGTQMLKKMFGGVTVFNNPKPVGFLHRLLQLGMDRDGICMDFFSGSATTAHAVMKLNAEDGGHRRYILVQLQEACPENSAAGRAGYRNICEIGKERIRRGAEMIRKERPDAAFDDGFRVLKLADSNRKNVYFRADEYEQDMLAGLGSNIKEDRTDLDLLYDCLLEWGLPLSLSCSSEETDGFTVYTCDEGELVACFGRNIPDKVIRDIAGRRPRRAVFRDGCFAGSPARINAEEIFRLFSPDTRLKVI